MKPQVALLKSMYEKVRSSMGEVLAGLREAMMLRAAPSQDEVQFKVQDKPEVINELMRKIMTAIPLVAGASARGRSQMEVKVYLYPGTGLRHFKMRQVQDTILSLRDQSVRHLLVRIKMVSRAVDDGQIYVVVAREAAAADTAHAGLSDAALNDLHEGAAEALALGTLVPGAAVRIDVWDDQLAEELQVKQNETQRMIAQQCGGHVPRAVEVVFEPHRTWVVGPALQMTSVFASDEDIDSYFNTPRDDDGAQLHRFDIEWVGTLVGGVLSPQPPQRVQEIGEVLTISRRKLQEWFGSAPAFANAPTTHVLNIAPHNDGRLLLGTEDSSVWASVAMRSGAGPLALEAVQRLTPDCDNFVPGGAPLYLACNVLKTRQTAVLRIRVDEVLA